MIPPRRVPLVRVPGPDGDTGPASWWQRREMGVALLHEECGACERLEERLRAREPLRLRDVGAAALRPGADGAAAAAAAVREALGLERGAAHVVVADRFGEVFASVPAHGASAQAVDEAERWIDHIQQQCPE